MNKIQLLPGMKFMSGGVLYRAGDILPDTADARELVRQKKAEWIDAAVDDESHVDSYETQNVRTLEAMAEERGIGIPRGTKKAGIIERLRVWDTEHLEADDEGDS
jgi:hypothetical protein